MNCKVTELTHIFRLLYWKGNIMKSNHPMNKLIPVESFFSEEHQVVYFDDFIEVLCVIKDEVYFITSSKGTKNIYCPGCGAQLYIYNK